MITESKTVKLGTATVEEINTTVGSNTLESMDYKTLLNLPTINGKKVTGDITLEEIGVVDATDDDIDSIIGG